MKKKFIPTVLLVVLVSAGTLLLSSWGFWGHQHISKAAVFALPEELRVFFYNHIDYITEEAVVPDLRRSLIDERELPRHFIDLEGFDSLPPLPDAAYAAYPDTFLQQMGRLPWHIQYLMGRLTQAMQQRRKTEILFIAADLSHYIADAHVPLHTTINYDGQLTNQKGIHSFWESSLPEQFGKAYNFHTEDAKYIEDVTQETWRIIHATHQLVEPLLAAERELKSSFPAEKLYQKDAQGNIKKTRWGQSIYSAEYATAYHTALNGTVEQQLRLSIAAISNFWYTAWVNAGKPNLASLDDPALTKRNKKNFKKEYKAWKKGKLLNLKSESDF